MDQYKSIRANIIYKKIKNEAITQIFFSLIFYLKYPFICTFCIVKYNVINMIHLNFHDVFWGN